MTEQPEQLMMHGREIAMTAAEQAEIRYRLLAYTIAHPSRAVAANRAWSWVRRHAIAMSVLTAVLVLGGTGVSAHMAGSNDALYGFRLLVNDRIEAALVFDEDAQLDVELRQIERQVHDEERALDEVLADEQEQKERDDEEAERGNEESKKMQELNVVERLRINLKAQLDSRKQSEDNDDDDRKENEVFREHRGGSTIQADLEIDAELRQLERELRMEESSNIELEI